MTILYFVSDTEANFDAWHGTNTGYNDTPGAGTVNAFFSYPNVLKGTLNYDGFVPHPDGGRNDGYFVANDSLDDTLRPDVTTFTGITTTTLDDLKTDGFILADPF